MAQNNVLINELTEQLRAAILLGEYNSNQRLIENELAIKYNTSRTPIRAAIRELSSSGLVKIIPNKGAMVSSINTDEIREIYAIRICLEGLASKLATPNISNETINELEGMVKSMEDSEARGDEVAFEEWNIKFHLSIYNYSDNKLLVYLINDLLDRSLLFRRTSWKSQRNKKHAINYHRKILSALIERDENKVQSLTERHIKAHITGDLKETNGFDHI